jgi:rhamnose transport system permease protein
VKTNTFTLIKKKHSLKEILLRWEWMLVLLLVLVNILNSQLSPMYLSFNGIMEACKVFLEKGFLVLGMALVLVISEIDVSVASTVALSATVMGIVYQAGEGLPMPLAILVCLGVATLCGFINGLLVASFRSIAAMIITLATMSLYRGIAWILLETQSAGGFPKWFPYLATGTLFNIGPYKIPFILVLFLLAFAVFYVILHRSTFGVKLYAIGNNPQATLYSGVNVWKTRVAVYTIMGFMAGVTALLLTSRIATTRPNVATGYELEVVAMTVLGGFKTDGGTGKMICVVLSVFLLGLIRYGMGLVNVRTEVVLVIVGGLLILSMLVPNLIAKFRRTPGKQGANQ